MKKTLIFLKILIPITFLIFQSNYSAINSKSNSSRIKLNSGTNFAIKNKISNYQGTLEKEENATITGNNIDFQEGKFKDSGNKLNITGSLENSGRIILDGDKHLRSKEGIVLQTIEVSGQNNKIEGNILVENDILILDENSSVTLAITNKLPVNIQLGSGTIYLQEDLDFLDGKQIIEGTRSLTEGVIESLERAIILNAEQLTWQKDIYFRYSANIRLYSNIRLHSSWTFGGGSIHIIDGNFNTLSLEELGQISVDKDSKLLIKNLTITGLSNTKLRCLFDNAQIIFQNVNVALSDNYLFQKGSFEISDDMKLYGPYNFIYQSTQESKITSKSNLILDKEVTFSYDPGIASKNLITFEDSSSILQLNNATLYTTVTGLQLTKGKLLINNNAFLSSEIQFFIEGEENILENNLTFTLIILDEGITLGNNNSDDDLECEISKGAKLNINGSLIYKNVNSNSWIMNQNQSAIEIQPNSSLKLYQSMNLDKGQINFYQNSNFDKTINKKIIGPINTLGKIRQRQLT